MPSCSSTRSLCRRVATALIAAAPLAGGVVGCAAAAAADASRATVQLAQGVLQGRNEDGLQVFRGIPYAGAPVGEWRWRPPRPVSPWRGLRDAGAFGAVCPQILQPGYSQEDLAGRPMSEDCLHLNVWTPQAGTAAKRPVMVWILPGGFRSGDAGMAAYDGRHLARRGVVVVTFNYRLGLFGEFAHPALSRAQAGEPLANYNLMDQIAALRWVRANIAVFGGDPANVTIFGMSAGGMSVNYLMASPAAAGLFDRAISQSSALRISHDRHLREDVGTLPSLESEGLRHAARLGFGGRDGDYAGRGAGSGGGAGVGGEDAGGARIAGTGSSGGDSRRDRDDAALLRGLRALTMAQLLDYQARNPIGTGGGLGPVIDGRILVQPVGEAFAQGRAHAVPYLTGATSWEGSLIRAGAAALDPVLQLLALTRAQVEPLYPQLDAGQLASQLYSDFFLATQRHLAAAHAQRGRPTFVYRFARRLEAHVADYTGAAHGAETRYVFGTLDDLPRLAGPQRPGDVGWRVGESDRAYAELLARYWVNFATRGDPNGEGLPGWPARSAQNDLLLEFDQQAPRLQRDFEADRQALFEAQFAAGKL